MNWELILIIVLAVVTLIGAGYLKRFKKEGSEAIGALKLLIDTFRKAMEDKVITPEEKTDLLQKIEVLEKESKDVVRLTIEVIEAFAKIRDKAIAGHGKVLVIVKPGTLRLVECPKCKGTGVQNDVAKTVT